MVFLGGRCWRKKRGERFSARVETRGAVCEKTRAVFFRGWIFSRRRSRFVVVEDGGFASVGSRGCVFVEERGGDVWREREIDRSGGACVRSTFERRK